MDFTFEEKELLRIIFKVLDKEWLIDKLRKLEIENNYNKKELKTFKRELILKIERLNVEELSNLFNEL